MRGIKYGGMKVIDRPLLRLQDICQCVTLHKIGSTNHAQQGGVGAKMNDARKRSEIGLSCVIGRSNQRDRLGSGKGSSELHTDQFVHGVDVGRGE